MMKQPISILVFVLFLFIGDFNICWAQLPTATFHDAIPDVPKTPRLVNDLGNMLEPYEEEQLETKLEDFEKQTTNEVTIVTVDTLGGLEVSQFANELGRKWNIGKQDRKNGVLVLVSKTDRKLNISPGYGLSGVLPDVICGRIIRNYITPSFKQGNYFQGLDEGVDAIIKASQGEFTSDGYDNGADPGGIPILLVLLIFGVFIFIFFFAIRNRKNIYVSRRGYRYGDDGGWSNLPSSGTGWFSSGGWGDSSSDSGGGFGGFGGGGGGFDGGGASGSW